MDGIEGRLKFLIKSERLKDVQRSGFTAGGQPESVAAHTWRLALMAIAFGDLLPEDVDRERLLALLIVHDLGEALSGDLPATKQTPEAKRNKSVQERADLRALTADLPDAVRAHVLGLWEEYDAGETPEARFAKGFDKLETLLQHTQGANPSDFDYDFNLDYGRSETDQHALLAAIRDLIDVRTRARMGNRD